MNDGSLTYLYGVVAAPGDTPPAALHGLDDAPVILLPVGDLAAITSRVSASSYGEEALDERLRDVAWVGERALAHERVLTWYADRMTVVPLTLFSLHADETRLRQRLEERADALRATLARVRGHREWGIRIWRDEPRFAARLDALSEHVRALSSEIAGAPPGRAFLLEKKREAMRADEARRLSRERAQHTMERLRDAAAEGSVLPVATPVEPSPERTLILHAAFLVADSSYGAFESAVQELAAGGDSDGFLYEFTGPWPPYHFASF